MRHLVLILLAAALSAGCSHLAPAATLVAPGAPGAKNLTTRDVQAMVAAAVDEDADLVTTGVPAILRAPSDALAQWGLQNEYTAAWRKAVPQIDPLADEALAQAELPRFFQQVPEVKRPEVVAYLQGVSDRLTRAAGVPAFTVHVADLAPVNAFNPGGHALVVFTGLILQAHDEAELAGVMAHEITHGLQRHVIRGMATNEAQRLARRAVQDAHPVPAQDLAFISAFTATLGPAQQYDQDFILGYLQGKIAPETLAYLAFVFNDRFTGDTLSRAVEAQADQSAVRLLAAAGYDPAGLVRLFDRMNVEADGDMRYYNHPAMGSRAGALRDQIQAEKLGGTDVGGDRLSAAKALLTPPPATPVGVLPTPAYTAGDGCFGSRVPRPLPIGH